MESRTQKCTECYPVSVRAISPVLSGSPGKKLETPLIDIITHVPAKELHYHFLFIFQTMCNLNFIS